jgi:hypothetical protein
VTIRKRSLQGDKNFRAQAAFAVLAPLAFVTTARANDNSQWTGAMVQVYTGQLCDMAYPAGPVVKEDDGTWKMRVECFTADGSSTGKQYEIHIDPRIQGYQSILSILPAN